MKEHLSNLLSRLVPKRIGNLLELIEWYSLELQMFSPRCALFSAYPTCPIRRINSVLTYLHLPSSMLEPFNLLVDGGGALSPEQASIVLRVP